MSLLCISDTEQIQELKTTSASLQKAKKTRTDSTAKAKPVKKEENLKVKKENATSKTQNASKRQKTNTEKINAAPANENKPKTRGTRSSKGQNLTFTIYLATFSIISIQILITQKCCPFLSSSKDWN